MDLSIIQKISIWAIPVIFAITVHEVAHGWVASKFGDQTARLAGRLTLNPAKHIDLVGTIIVPLLLVLLSSSFLFGWAKPVPVDARNMRNPRTDMALVALAGPFANFIMAMMWAMLARFSGVLPPWFEVPLLAMGLAGIQINIMLGVLNCIPIPPLDGSRIVYFLLSGRLAWQYSRIEPYGFFILLFFMFTGILYYLVMPPYYFMMTGIYRIFSL